MPLCSFDEKECDGDECGWVSIDPKYCDMKIEKPTKKQLKTFGVEGVPDRNSWSQEDWIDFHKTLKCFFERIAKRHKITPAN